MKKLRIGILTYHRAINYGAILQSYALQTYLEQRGFDASLVDYWPDYHKAFYKIFNFQYFRGLPFKSKISYLFQTLSVGRGKYIKKRRFDRFIDEYLKVSNDCSFDIVIYGSDQIWRKQNYLDNTRRFNPIYFGNEDIIAPKKIAYAASMGHCDVNTADVEFLNSHLRNFSNISVREDDLQLLVQSCTSAKVALVVDPTLLVPRKVWDDLLDSKSRYVNDNYILFYRLQPIKEADAAVEALSKKLGAKVYIVAGSPLPFNYSDSHKETVSVEDFLNLVANARFVVTTSFHGLAMSIQFNRQFFAFTTPTTANRLNSLLSSLKLSDRLNPSDIDCVNEINYNTVNTRLEDLREKSSSWLINAISK